MLEGSFWLMWKLYSLITDIWLGIFTKSSIPIFIFLFISLLSFVAFLYFQIKGKNATIKKYLGYAATFCFVIAMITTGMASKGLAVDTLDQSVQIFPTGDYVIAGITQGISGVNLVLAPLKDYRGADTVKNSNDWRSARLVHFIPEQLHKIRPRVGQEITVANVGKTFRVFERLQPLPGDKKGDKKGKEKNKKQKSSQAYGMIGNK